MHHKGRNDVGKALFVDHEIARVGKHRLMQPRDIAEQIVKAHARDASGGFFVDAIKALHDVHMVGDFKIGHDRLSEALDLDVAAVVRADGDGRVNDVRDHIHDLADARVHLRDRLIERCSSVVVCFDGGVILVDLRLELCLFRFIFALFKLAVQRAVGLRQLVARSLEALDLRDRGAALLVQVNDLVYQRKLHVLKFLADIFLDCFGIFP